MQDLLFAADAHEHPPLRSEVGEHDDARLLLGEAVTIGDEGVLREGEITFAATDLQRGAAGETHRAERAAFEDLHHAERRRRVRREPHVRRAGAGAVVARRVALDAEELIADDELVAGLELDRPTDTDEETVAAFEVLEEQLAVLEVEDALARVAEALALERHVARRADDHVVAGRLVFRGALHEAADDLEHEANGRALGRQDGRRGRRRRDGFGVRALFSLRASRRELLQIDLRGLGEDRHAAHRPARDHLVELALAEGEDHLHVLRFHQRAHEGRSVGALGVLGVGALVALDDATAVGEAMGDDVRQLEPGVLRLDVEDLVLVLDVVVEADLGAHELRARPFLVELLDLLRAEALDGLVERRVIARAARALHALEGGLGDR